MRSIATILLLALLSFTAASQTSNPKKPKSAAAKPRAAATPKKPVDEKTLWESTIATTDPAARAKALRKFVQVFPNSEKTGEAATLIIVAAVEEANQKLQAGDGAGAVELYRAAINSAPSPVPDTLFGGTLAGIPATVYFRADRQGGYDLAKLLEEKAAASAGQLVAVATFYLTVENGTEARRLAERALTIDAAYAPAYETLGLANRMDFDLDASAAAYTKALELAPASASARRGLAEMKRSLGKADEAIALYREILAQDETSIPARTGLILAMFDAGQRADAEAELTKALEATPGNVILLAGAAYWYAAHSEGVKAVELARKAVDADPRYIWSHIAMARGYLSLGNAVDAERTLIAARRYGNFPTLEYEIASARAGAGYYREAAEELAKSFSVKDGVIKAKLGGRVPRESSNFTELVGLERRASIFASTAADDPESAARLTSLLELKQELDQAQPDAAAVTRTAEAFIKGSDPMKVHRQIYVAGQLLDKKTALPQVVEITRSATANIDAGLSITSPSVAVMANDLYENRSLAATKGEFLNIPEVGRPTLLAILRGRVEEISGWALFNMQETKEAVVRLKRAVSVLPVDSHWWRTSTWRLGTALAAAGENAEALDFYIKSYKSAGTPIQYNAIVDLYTRMHGSTEGLDQRIAAPAKPVVALATATPEPADENAAPTSSAPVTTAARRPARIPRGVPVATPVVSVEPTPEPTAVVAVQTPPPEPSPEPTAVVAVQTATPEPSPEPTAATPEPSPEPTAAVAVQTPTPEPSPERTAAVAPQTVTPGPSPEPTAVVAVQTPTIEPSPEPSAVVVTTPEPMPAELPAATPGSTPAAEVKAVAAREPTPEELPVEPPVAAPSPTPEPAPAASPESGTPAPERTPQTSPTVVITSTLPTSGQPERPAEVKPDPGTVAAKTSLTGNDLFPPVVITIPPPPPPRQRFKDFASTPKASPTPSPASEAESAAAEPERSESEPQPDKPEKESERPAVEPCALSVSEDTVRLQSMGGNLAVIVGLGNDGELGGITAISSSPDDVSVRREVIEGVATRALFVLRSISQKTGVYQVRFEMPCGKREIVVRVR